MHRDYACFWVGNRLQVKIYLGLIQDVRDQSVLILFI